jgi:uracil-DNA glycosylase
MIFSLFAQLEKLSLEWQAIFAKVSMHTWLNIEKIIQQDMNKNIQIFPKDIFYVFRHMQPKDISICILGQDPYHGGINIQGTTIAQAHGLAFSVPHTLPIPPSLKNIDKELNASLGIPYSQHGCLDAWMQQGIFLLNAILTVRENQAASHASIGWEDVTQVIINALAKNYTHIVWLLWGKYAQQKSIIIEAYNPTQQHLILCSSHPSPLSAYRGFLGCGHFRQAQAYIQKHKKYCIDFKR